MNLKKRIFTCIILLLFLAAVCLVGLWQQAGNKKLPAMGPAENSRKIALTFDDGPHPYYTEQLVDGLNERGVKATFFMIGKNVEANPEIVKKVYDSGHLIGNHTYNHTQLTKQNRESFREELIKTNEAISKITGEDTIYIRPPYGSWSKEFEKELNMFPVLWTVDPQDWCSKNTAGIVNKVCTKTKENDIILLHDQYKTTVTAALEIVDRLTAEGYEFVTVEELLFD